MNMADVPTKEAIRQAKIIEGIEANSNLLPLPTVR